MTVKNILLLVIFAQCMSACSSKIVSTNYYNLNKDELLQIEEKYKRLNKKKQFALTL